MFSGIVQKLCRVSQLQKEANILKLEVDLEELAENLQLGASVAINGICLTVVSIQNTKATFDVIHETLQLTNLQSLEVHDFVNVERSLRVGDEIGGHQVQGHVDGTGVITEVINDGIQYKVWVSFQPQFRCYLVPKGWVCVDGVSLTLVDIKEDTFAICLIPETLKRTTLGLKKEQSLVNLEFDAFVKTVVAVMNEQQANTWLTNEKQG